MKGVFWVPKICVTNHGSVYIYIYIYIYYNLHLKSVCLCVVYVWREKVSFLLFLWGLDEIDGINNWAFPPVLSPFGSSITHTHTGSPPLPIRWCSKFVHSKQYRAPQTAKRSTLSLSFRDFAGLTPNNFLYIYFYYPSRNPKLLHTLCFEWSGYIYSISFVCTPIWELKPNQG